MIFGSISLGSRAEAKLGAGEIAAVRAGDVAATRVVAKLAGGVSGFWHITQAVVEGLLRNVQDPHATSS